MRAEDVKLGMRVVVQSDHSPFDGQVGTVAAIFGHPSCLVVDLRLDDGSAELFWARQVWPYAAGMGKAQEKLLPMRSLKKR